MADVRCQMCGKSNPPELEECQFCGARIKPVSATPLGSPDSTMAGEEAINKDVSELGREKSAEERAIPRVKGESLGESSSDEKIPDWLTDLRSDEPSASAAPSDSEAEAAGIGDEDWIARLDNEKGSEAPEAPETVPTSQAENALPDWLSDSFTASTEDESKKATPEETLPDWLGRLEGKDNEPELPSPVAGEESLPDWLSDVKPGAGTLAASLGEELQSESSSAGETPDQQSLAEAETKENGKEIEAVSESEAPSEEASPIPEWLAGVDRPVSQAEEAQASVDEGSKSSPEGDQEASSVELPEWLSDVTPEQGVEKGVVQGEGQPVPEDLEMADLPSWVQAMRPVESVVAETMSVPSEEDQITEQNGPLAGLRGVLPSTPGLGPLRRPPAYSVKLEMSEGQQRYAASLEQLIAGETTPRTVGVERLTSNRLWRWLIALLLILATGIPLFRGTQIVSETSLLSSDKGATAAVLEELPADVPVLVAFDYDPALSGELEATAAPFVDALMERGTPLAFISTSPTGPALAEHFMQTMLLVGSHQYHSGEQYVNLGYLTGGSLGMLYFVGDPVGAMPFTVDGRSAWETGPLQDIQGVSGFAAFVILTDNADTARNWVEQAAPRLGDVPMIMIISAQAEPIIRPYFESGQLKGLVSGLSDAKIYEQSENRPGLAHLYWSAFSVGILVAVLLIIVGAIWNAVAGWYAQHRSPGEEA